MNYICSSHLPNRAKHVLEFEDLGVNIIIALLAVSLQNYVISLHISFRLVISLTVLSF